jgi:hypothetical protein
VRVLFATAYFMIGISTWQTVLVELVDSHASEPGECPDDEGGDCDCGPNCHCCLACAHHGTPAMPQVAPPPLGGTYAPSQTIVLGPPIDLVTQSEEGPPTKVPLPAA